MNKVQQKIDNLAEAKKGKDFLMYSQIAKVRVRLAAEVYKVRIEKGWSQQELAKRAQTTQRVISNIESGDVNIGIDLFTKVMNALEFSGANLETIFSKQLIFSISLNQPEEKPESKNLNLGDKNEPSATYNSSNSKSLAPFAGWVKQYESIGSCRS